MEPKYCPFCGHNNVVELTSISAKDHYDNWMTLTEYICHDDACGKSFYIE